MISLRMISQRRKYTATNLDGFQQENQRQQDIRRNRKHHYKKWTLHTFLLASILVSFSIYQYILYNQQLPTSIFLDILPAPLQKEARVLIGIFTTIDGDDKQKWMQNDYKSKFRDLFKLHSNVCSIGDLRRNEHKKDQCKFIYAFVVGASQDPSAPTVLYNDDREVELSRLSLPFLPGKDAQNYDDFVFLNIHENMNDGKSLSWFYYVATNKFISSLQIDYVGKMDTDVLLDLKQYFEFSKNHLAPAPYNKNTIVGHFLKKNEEFKQLSNHLVEDNLELNYSGVRLYPQGGFYLMSVDLAQSIIKFVQQKQDFSFIDLPQIHEDEYIGTLAFLSVEKFKETIKPVLISKSSRFHIHPFKRKIGRRWIKLWDEILKSQAQDQPQNNDNEVQRTRNHNSLFYHSLRCEGRREEPNTDCDKVYPNKNENADTSKPSSLQDFININQQLTSFSSSMTSKSCICGCAGTKGCTRQYNAQDVIKSANVNLTGEVIYYMDSLLQERKKMSQAACAKLLHMEGTQDKEQTQQNDYTTSGGWCLRKFAPPLPSSSSSLTYNNSYHSIEKMLTYPKSNHTVPIPLGHVRAPDFMIMNLQRFIEKENVTSISDFGAGIGQYGSKLEALFPHSLLYKGYDGAGDVEEYTHGYLKFFDLSIPLNLPKTDWIFSFEVGEHIPHHLEGIMIRNLHTHNCKGIILSWGVEGQDGDGHVNLHNNDYVVDIFQELGYMYDIDESNAFRRACPKGWTNGWWFRKSLMVFRRTNPVC